MYAGKTDRELLVEIYTDMKEVAGILEDHEGRIRCLQNEQNKFIGGLTVIGVILGLIGAKLLGLLKLFGF